MIAALAVLAVASFLVSLAMTAAMIRVAPAIGFVDKPGGRKIHANPKPLGGGVAIVCGILLPLIVALLVVALADSVERSRAANRASAQTLDTLPSYTHITIGPIKVGRAYVDGLLKQFGLGATFIACIIALHALGLIDDRNALGPLPKLAVQLLAAAALTVPFPEVRALTTFGTIPSIVLSILWIAAITNAFNFLDNMDGLSAGVAAVCTVSFLITTILIEQWFIAATLALLFGSLLGFLFWNFPPAKIFMGDSGSLVIGFMLGVLTIRTTYLRPGEQLAAGWYSVFAPVVVLALPLYDLIVVSTIRLSRGRSPFVGDTNHFSHRLVARGMSRRTAVLCLYLVTAATAVAAILLPYTQTTFAAILIFIQTLLVLGVVALLEQHPLPIDHAFTQTSESA